MYPRFECNSCFGNFGSPKSQKKWSNIPLSPCNCCLAEVIWSYTELNSPQGSRGCCVYTGRKCVKEHVSSTSLTPVNHFHPPLIQLALLENMWIIWNPLDNFPFCFFPSFSLGWVTESDSNPLTLKGEINDKGALQVCIRDLIGFGLSGPLAMPDVGSLCFAMWENLCCAGGRERGACRSSLSHPCNILCLCGLWVHVCCETVPCMQI